MNKTKSLLRNLLLVALMMLGFNSAFADDPTTAAGVVTAVGALAASTTTLYISFAVLGLGILGVSWAVYAGKRGIKTR